MTYIYDVKLRKEKMINNVIAKRKSIRDFDSRILDEEIIISLFEAARRAPSAFNEQPWRFILADRKNEAEFSTMLDVLVEKNREWAKNASALVIVLSKKQLSKNERLNKHYMYDTASAVANLTFQANSLDLYVHQMGGYNAQSILEKYLVPDEYETAVVLAIGRKAASDLEKTEIIVEVKRNPLYEILFKNKFGEPHSILVNQNVMNN
jgi:nitroreductase